jgi:hypothetical protein
VRAKPNMATTTAPRPLVGRSDHPELRRFLNALRLQLWWREALVLIAGGALLGAVLSAVLTFWILPVCLAFAAALAVVRRPSTVRAARAADRQLHTWSRLATAAEVLSGHLSGPLAPDQLDDTWRVARALSPVRAFPRLWRQVWFALGALALSGVVVGLAVAGLVSPLDLEGLSVSGSSPDVAVAPAAEDQALADSTTASPATASSMDELQSQAAQSQAAQAALQRLGDALRPTSAARDIGDALRAGNYDDAMGKLDTLATQSDQLSRTSKRELGAAMERAAVDTAKSDPPLAVAEDRVARALNRNVYSETRSAMQNLSKAVADARNGVISQEALARELAQLQQTQPQVPGGGGGDIGESAEGYFPDIPGEAPQQPGLVQGISSTISVPGPEGDPNAAKRSSVGQEAGGDPFGDVTSRLDVSATDLSVQAQVTSDQGRQGLKANPVAPVVKISDATQSGETPSDVAQPSDPVQATAEQNVEPTTQRTAVRTFFKPDPETATP